MKIPNHFYLLFFGIIMLSFSCRKVSSFSKKAIVENKRIIGQAAPADMVFIPGDKEIPSFYMGVSEEPNINYLIYLRWLKNIFSESYPEVYEEALPKQHKQSDLFKFNDPYITNYMTHPAFSYYPVTGLSWIQIQNYLQWKTDRLNEAILVKTGIYNFNPEQKDEDNFNTEAHLYDQYQGDVRKMLPDKVTRGERSVSFNDGILFPGFRLPTEAEWEYASQQRFQKEIDRKRCLNPFAEDAINHPYGQDYFPLLWGELYEESASLNYNNKVLNYRQDIINVSSNRTAGFKYTPDEHDKNGTPQRLTSIGDYDAKAYGLINMNTNVREWLLDFYETTYDATQKDPVRILEQSGFKTEGAAILDENKRYVEKDSLGKMRYFRILGVAHDGKALEVGTYLPRYYQRMKRKERLQEEQVNREKRLVEIQKKPAVYEMQKDKMLLDIDLLKFLLKKNKTSEETEKYSKYSNYYSYTNTRNGNASPYMWQYNLERLQRNLINFEVDLLKEKIVQIKTEVESLKQYLEQETEKKRLVKGGTWKNPGKQRMGLEESKSDVEVGFRCVLPYTGMPVRKGYKVKWKR